MKREYTFESKVCVFPGKAVWYYTMLPKDTAEDINFYFGDVKRGWGSLPVNVTVGATTWKTSIFTDKKEQSFLLLLKKEVRLKESMQEEDMIKFSLEISR